MKYLADLADDFLSLLFPRICCGCGTYLVRNEHIICTECYIGIPRTGYEKQASNPVEMLFWGRCRVEKAAAFSFYAKGSRIRRIIHELKYRGKAEAGRELGKIYGRTLKDSGFLNGIDQLIPVPLHLSREKKRGFNQSLVIAEGLSESTGIAINTEALKRGQVSDTQTKRSRYDRWVNVEGIFYLASADSINNLHVLLIDDVITTGSTIESCVTALQGAGNVRVSVAALAFSVQ